ncbi:lytic murein transglycosylase B [Aliidiomarina taiwanensis]|uniref:Lytic murein transglycosylase B n=2 Tax=Aliidiomarina taiwanensis TaxID=946228 RepID=A0A432XAI7_9GAMM|nr:lytic murein transglycosylase B [Aliidiomarina taiwanensis]
MMLASFFLMTPSLTATASETAAANSQHATFYQELESKHQVPRVQAERILAQAQVSDAVLEAITTPWEAKPWYQYYPIFLTPSRLEKGLAFWQEHKESLERAEQTYGVPAEVIVAIIGVETYYGGYLGRHKVLDALYTLAFHYPPRARFFRSELGHFLALTQEEQLNPTELMGSYAGAMGYGQFISSSYRAYAVDFDGDGQRDLLTNPVDAIGSVANYFAKHHWQPGQPIATPAWVGATTDTSAFISNRGQQLTHTVADLQSAGIRFTTEAAPGTKARLFKFEEENNEASYWVALPNFYSITRYNHSPLYAMVVYQLSEQLRRGAQGL